jgi:hypothetical protein
MEVHAHSHSSPAGGGAPRKKWTHYFWEFLMLFLAVFCGFLAENQREHGVEHRREKQYLQSLQSDLKKDTAFYNSFEVYLTRVSGRLDSIEYLINSREYLTNPNGFYQLASSSRRMRFFEYHSSSFEQMKSSGNLRLIRQMDIADSLADYYFTVQERVNTQESRYTEATANIATAMWEVFDAKYFPHASLLSKQFINNNPIRDSSFLKNIDEQKLMKYKNMCYEKTQLLFSLRDLVQVLNKKASKLLFMIQDKYHLK